MLGPYFPVAPVQQPVLLLWHIHPGMLKTIYVGVYTIGLKPHTVLNIVIVGAAGSEAVMSGGAAVGNWQDPGVITLALLIFLWTPAHFWSLAIMYRDAYKLANVPMRPPKLSVQLTSRWDTRAYCRDGRYSPYAGSHCTTGMALFTIHHVGKWQRSVACDTTDTKSRA